MYKKIIHLISTGAIVLRFLPFVSGTRKIVKLKPNIETPANAHIQPYRSNKFNKYGNIFSIENCIINEKVVQNVTAYFLIWKKSIGNY